MIPRLPPLFQIWDEFLPIVLAPGATVVFAETANFNFDTSDVSEFSVGSPPVISGSVNSGVFSLLDNNLILLGHSDAVDTPETTGYHELVRFEPSALIGGTVLGLQSVRVKCQNLTSGQVVTGPAAGTLNCAQLGLLAQPNDVVIVGFRGMALPGAELPPQPVGATTDVRCGNGQIIHITTGTDGGSCGPANPNGKTECRDGGNVAVADCISHNCGGMSGKGDCNLK